MLVNSRMRTLTHLSLATFNAPLIAEAKLRVAITRIMTQANVMVTMGFPINEDILISPSCSHGIIMYNKLLNSSI